MRKSYGNTWWGQQWLNALKQIDYSNRLPRGRTYANKGLARDIEISGNLITANVQGTRPRPYKVKFAIPKFTNKQQAQITEAVINHPLYLSELLNRKLPPQIMQLCAQKGIELFPATWHDISGSCSCPDIAVPCKHMAAVLYLVANEIDQYPFLAFELHDFDLFDALRKAGYTTQEHQDIKILSHRKLREPFDEDRGKVQWDAALFDQLDFSILPECKDKLLSILSDKPVFFPSGNFKQLLEATYSAVAKTESKRKRLDTTTSLDNKIDQIENITLLLDEKLKVLDVNFANAEGGQIFYFSKLDQLTEWLDTLSLQRLSQYAPMLRGLWLTWQLTKKLALKSAFIPQLLEKDQGGYVVRWIPAYLNAVVRSCCDQVARLVSDQLVFYKITKGIEQPILADAFTSLISIFLNFQVADSVKIKDRNWETEVVQLFFNREAAYFNDYETKAYPELIQLWLNKFYIGEKEIIPVVRVKDSDEGFIVDIAFEDQRKKSKPIFGLKSMMENAKHAGIRMDALRDLAMLSEYFPEISDLVAIKGKEPLVYDEIEFVDVLFKILPTIRLFGIKVILPKALQKLIRPQLSMSITGTESGVVKQKSLINVQDLLNFDWRIALGEEVISREDFLKMIRRFKGIVGFKNQYVFFDEAEIQKLIDQLENPPELTSHEVLQAALSEDYNGARIDLDAATRQLIDELLSTKSIEPPISLEATLRPYQQTGYEWLYKNTRLGFGSLIADDMGLGKTLQVITMILRLKEDGALDEQKVLVVVPTTLLTNWQKEIARFAPELSAHVYHGSNRKLEPLKEADILITTYGIARTETIKLQKQDWLVMVIDEAQAIKNPGTAQSKAIKKLKVPVKIAMSGTPVENRLSEYWSVFDFANKGYLGSLKKFKDEYAKPIEADRDLQKLAHFKKITAPFIIRRLKSDKSIIDDLPDKVEQDQFCQLTPEQAALYQNVVDSTLKQIEKAEGISRKGLVLKLITTLKQVCNHPYQFLKKGDKNANLSGKTLLLFQLLQQILENGEKTIIFTQYREMGNLLQELLLENFALTVPFLHGGVSRKGRDAMVEDFQNNRATRIMILSLKAAGTGLNLTAASNVIHYDLWWNPAVEAQATDRAYRIGQKRNVLVHRFIMQETFEEKINEMLKSKKELADLTVVNGEKWIGEFNDDELRNLVNRG